MFSFPQHAHLSTVGFLLVIFLTGCLSSSLPPSEAVVSRLDTSLRLDGVLAETAWQNTPSYPFAPGKPFAWGKPILERTGFYQEVAEETTIRFLRDDRFLYLGVEMRDSDLVGEGGADGERLYMLGDCLEIFLHPRNVPFYWEFYASINEKKTVFFFPGRGRLNLPSNSAYRCDGMIVKTAFSGTFNQPADHDQGWSAEIAIPLATLAGHGVPFDNNANWSVLVVRYNYSAWLPLWETSCFPAISTDNPHLYEDYIPLDIR